MHGLHEPDSSGSAAGNLHSCLWHVQIGRQASSDQLQQVKEFCRKQRCSTQLMSWCVTSTANARTNKGIPQEQALHGQHLLA